MEVLKTPLEHKKALFFLSANPERKNERKKFPAGMTL